MCVFNKASARQQSVCDSYIITAIAATLMNIRCRAQNSGAAKGGRGQLTEAPCIW